jgi:CheY-like chemotaxis protein
MLQQALDQGDPFPLVLTDRCMPEVGGVRLAIPVLMMLYTTVRQPDPDPGVARYLTKPVRSADLKTAIETVLSAEKAASAISPAGKERRGPDPPARRLHILLAEDNLVNQRLARRILEKAGHTVAIAANGREAVEMTGQRSFDVVLMDVQMPEMDGFEATAEIRRREAGRDKHLPIVAMTAHAISGDRDRCLAAGMDDYISKPISARDLLNLLAKYAYLLPAPG